MAVKTHSRRTFISSTSQLLSGAWLASHWPEVASAAHHAEVTAIPSGATPGAREAHVTVFVDRALASFLAGMSPLIHAGLADFSKGFDAKYPAAKGFAAAKPEEQAAYLGATEQTPFFQTIRLLTVLGFLSSPKYGGNANGIGWKAIGFDDQHVFQPPFGYYDREYTGFVPYDTGKHT
jgi:hypothetical protein